MAAHADMKLAGCLASIDYIPLTFDKVIAAGGPIYRSKYGHATNRYTKVSFLDFQFHDFFRPMEQCSVDIEYFAQEYSLGVFAPGLLASRAPAGGAAAGMSDTAHASEKDHDNHLDERHCRPPAN
jgi:hypothetical protein